MQKLDMQTPDLTEANVTKIAELFPQVITEAEDEEGNLVKKVDFDLLRQELSKDIVEDTTERYRLDRPGKNRATLKANTPITKTLRPVKEESLNWDSTQNLYLEGDNFDVLKILQESYLGKVKMIYIDPPYNTGKDFVYKDNFKMSKDEYDEEIGAKDEDGGKLFKNTDTNGRYHSDWLSMMYSRLKVAKDLLTEDGVIFMSIDENEYVNLKKLCDEVFGEENYIENFIWIKNSTKNNSRTTSTNHEYVLCFAKNMSVLQEKQIFRVKKPGLDEVYTFLKVLEKKQLSINEAEKELKKFYKENPQFKGISSYDRLEYKSSKKNLAPEAPKHYLLYTLADASAPLSSGTGPMYDILHPKTGRPCVCPSTGWRYTRATMDEHLKNGLIYFYDDETKVPRFKRFLDTVETEVVKSILEDFTDGKKELLRIFDGFNPFDNPKPTTLLEKLLRITNKEDIILDFFSGSATTAHAVMQINAEDGGNRKWIMTQLPEETEPDSEAYKAGYKYITEIGKERIRRAGQKILEDNKDKAGIENLDLGFRVYRVDSSNMKDVYYHPTKIRQDKLEFFESNVKEDRTPLDLLTQVILDLGLTLDLPIKEKTIKGHSVFFVAENALIACFDESIDESIIDEIATHQPLKVVFRDASFRNDADRINVETKMKRLSPDTTISII